MTKQTNWKVWHWPWHRSYHEWYYGDGSPNDYEYTVHFAGIGPFQFNWYSK